MSRVMHFVPAEVSKSSSRTVSHSTVNYGGIRVTKSGAFRKKTGS